MLRCAVLFSLHSVACLNGGGAHTFRGRAETRMLRSLDVVALGDTEADAI